MEQQNFDAFSRLGIRFDVANQWQCRGRQAIATIGEIVEAGQWNHVLNLDLR